ncbi:hypothetical protein [Paenibacillus mendelii]|uniref:Uncharacterized protein n=1 Tax=Paenibacillus mendelii TaxID=206163 RepID=A0ABV6JF76_9BACL|nr:hypothetical protein [Paenibacillus mendelii]MCQ6557444.1 hypothetical protein [Paenibacillus mendelii]
MHNSGEEIRNTFELYANEAGWGIKRGGEPLIEAGDGKGLPSR